MSGARILIVEDERIVQLDLQQRLKRMGHTVVAATATGEDAVAKAAECMPDVVIMDVHLQGSMDGIEAARRIRANHGTPIVYVTAYATSLGNGAQDIFGPCLSKPFSERELSAAIIQSIGGRDTRAAQSLGPQ